MPSCYKYGKELLRTKTIYWTSLTEADYGHMTTQSDAFLALQTISSPTIVHIDLNNQIFRVVIQEKLSTFGRGKDALHQPHGHCDHVHELS